MVPVHIGDIKNYDLFSKAVIVLFQVLFLILTQYVPLLMKEPTPIAYV